MEERHWAALERIHRADELLRSEGREPETFRLWHRGAMEREINHPRWDPTWAAPSEETIDDLGDLGILRVAPSHNKARSFSLTTTGREAAANLLAGGSPPAGPAHSGMGVQMEPRRVAAGGNPSTVMVVHGQDEAASQALFDWLRAVGLKPREWSQLVHASGSGSPFIGDVLKQAFRDAQAVVVLFTPDEHAALRGGLGQGQPEWRLQARPNVLFEAGMAFASHPEQTVLVVLGDQELPSDLAGRHYVRLGTPQALRDLARRLERAGCPVDLTGEQWLDTGRFPTRVDVEVRPDGFAPTGNEASITRRKDAYQALIAAHEQLVQANAGPRIYKSEVLAARTAFGEAQSAVIIHGSTKARAAAEELRAAWEPRANGVFMGFDPQWRSEVETARRNLVAAISDE